MGQIAEDMIDGTCCDLCGCYYVDKKDNLYTHDHPATCNSCWSGLSAEDKKHRQRQDKGINTL